MKRKPAVSGQFYQSDPGKLSSYVDKLIQGGPSVKTSAIGVLCPHAGFMYSGSVAGAVYAEISAAETFVLVGPNHTGMGPRISLMREGEWEVPNGVFEIDSALADSILKEAPDAEADMAAHVYEHSLEVQLPFIAQIARGSRIVPITVMGCTLTELKSFGEALSRAISGADRSVLIVASSDMSHYVTDTVARSLDRLAIDRVLALDPDGLYDIVKDKGITMCGFMPAVIMLSASKALGARQARLIKYTTSAETSGDYEKVVGYAGIVVS